VVRWLGFGRRVQAEQAAARPMGRSQFASSDAPAPGESAMARASVDLNRTDDAVYRRQFLGSGGGVLASVAISGTAAAALTRLVEDLTAYGTGLDVQASRLAKVTEVLRSLPDLLVALSAVRPQSSGTELSMVHQLRADAYHVMGSVLLKVNDPALRRSRPIGACAPRSKAVMQRPWGPALASRPTRCSTPAPRPGANVRRARGRPTVGRSAA
jgi:hypothetical protein